MAHLACCNDSHIFVFCPNGLLCLLALDSKNALFKSATPSKQYMVGVTNLILRLLVVIGTLWSCGGLMSSDLSDSGFGSYRTTLSSVFDPQVNGIFTFSRIIPNLGNIPGTEEGFAFLGISVFILLATSFVLLFWSRNPLLNRDCLLLVLGTVAMAVYSLSNRIALL